MSESGENEFICQQLLGWVRVPSTSGASLGQAWRRSTDDAGSFEVLRTPKFRNWAEAGLILDALTARGWYPMLAYERDRNWVATPDRYSLGRFAATGPEAVRQAALMFLGLPKS